MLDQCGYNEFFQLNEKSNNQSTYKTPVVSPYLQSQLDISTILSYSIFGNHSIKITQDNRIYAIGDNRDNQISESLPKEVFNQYTEFTIQDPKGRTCSPISSICGKFFTLSLVTNPDHENHFQLVLSYKGINRNSPLFLNIGDRNPISLFGGYFNAAAIDSEGAILFVNYRKVNISPSQKIEPAFLPEGEKAAKLACCKDVIFCITSSGRLFQSFTSCQKLAFSEVTDFSGLKIIDISGSFWHCFAVSDEGRVFGWGANYGGRLGLGKEIEEVDKFTEIESLSGHVIKAVFAGSTHSLFVSSEGKVFACGSNTCGELFLAGDPCEEFAFNPVETLIEKDAVFCIAGDTLSAAFIGSCPPNCPNMKVCCS